MTKQLQLKEKEISAHKQESDMQRNRVQDLHQKVSIAQQQIRQIHSQNTELGHLDAQQIAKLNQ